MGNVIVTGGLGFIGSHFIRHALANNLVDSIFNIDYMGYGSNLVNLDDVKDDSRYNYVNADLNDRQALELISQKSRLNAIINFAAETHVDRSIANPLPFIHSNINGVITLLEFSRAHDVETYLQISTDEVYGTATNNERFTEEQQLKPNNPYSASKASADLIVRAYNRTYGLKTVITRCANNFGPNQFPEKLIPKTIVRAMQGLSIPIYGDGLHTREWIYVIDHIIAVCKVIEKGRSGQIYNISSSKEVSNIDIITKISNILLHDLGIETKIEHVPDRPAHDRRYSLDSSKIRNDLGWAPSYSFETALRHTVEWYVRNSSWWKPLVTEETIHPQPWELTKN